MTALGIAFLVIGAILRFAVSFETSGVDLQLIGLILMVAGGASALIGLIRGSFTSTRTERHVSGDGQHVVEESSSSGL